jgi:integrase
MGSSHALLVVSRLRRSRTSDEQRFLSRHQMNALSDAISHRYQALVYLAAYGGLRAGELEARQVSRLNLLAGSVKVVESLS